MVKPPPIVMNLTVDPAVYIAQMEKIVKVLDDLGTVLRAHIEDMRTLPGQEPAERGANRPYPQGDTDGT